MIQVGKQLVEFDGQLRIRKGRISPEIGSGEMFE
jgi:hypothetical protein